MTQLGEWAIAAGLGVALGSSVTSIVWWLTLSWWKSTPEWRIYEAGFVAGRKLEQSAKEAHP